MSFEKTRATITTDLSYGDAGKGTTTEWLASQSDSAAIIRFNGGGQAEHNIITPDGRHHTFSQFGSASFLPNTVNHLSRDMWVNPINMEFEAEHLIDVGVHDVWERTTVDEDAKIVTPYHRAGNRLRELARMHARHGSTGQGISEAVMDDMFRADLTLRAGDITRVDLIERLEQLRCYKRDQFKSLGSLLAADTPDWEALNDSTASEWYAEQYADWRNKIQIVSRDYLGILATHVEHLIFEPAQGILLDEKRGFHPHTTWSNTTPDNARQQLEDINFSGDLTTLGIVRAYTTRHGFGPFVTEDTSLDGPLHEYFNGTGPWQGGFRIGHFDPIAHRYAASAAGHLDGLVVTGIDRVETLPTWQYATGYEVNETVAAESLYAMHSGVATDILLSEYGDKLHMSRLTESLFGAKPVYEAIKNPTRDAILQTIQKEMGMRIVLVSEGPTVNDKYTVDDDVLLKQAS
jgi:adenylosuccinate synthase